MAEALTVVTILSLLVGSVVSVKTAFHAAPPHARMLGPPPSHPGGVQAP